MASALLLRHSLPRSSGNNHLARCLVSANRSHSTIASAAGNNSSCNTHHEVSHQHQHQQQQQHRQRAPYNNNHRWASKYAIVDHSSAYQEAISSQHGTQLQLALEEGRGKDNAPFDPFSQFLDEMGTTSEILPGPDGDVDSGSSDDDIKSMEGIEEAEYKTIEEYKESGKFDEKNLIDFEEVDMSAADEDDDSDMEDGDDDDDDGLMPLYTNTGALYRPKSERLALRAGYPSGGKFAVIHLAGFQHKVTVDDLLVVNKLRPVAHWSVGTTHTLKDEDILLMADQEKTLVGLPGVQGGEVDVMVEEITRDKTMVVFKKRRRKHSRRKNGFRRQVTFLRVLGVRMPGEEVPDSEGSDGEGDEVQQMAA